jgi:uncharacterized damage-inducible protein DinB
MNKQALLETRGYFDMVHGVTVRAIGAFADEDLDYRPKPGMRSPRELIYHIYSFERALVDAARQGRFTPEAEKASNPETEEGKAQLAGLKTVAQLQQFARDCHKAAGEALATLSDEDVERPVEASYGSFPAWQFFQFAYDEHWHHRGQLYTYLRLLGKEPPMLYDYEH